VRSPVEIRLLADPDRLSMAERERFRIGVVAANTGPTAIDADLFSAYLLVNGERSTAFDLAIGNGVVPVGWDVLPAGETTPAVEYRLGEALFSEPGEYRLELVLGGGEGAHVEATRTVVVMP
jgi:hypothetical protein